MTMSNMNAAMLLALYSLSTSSAQAADTLIQHVLGSAGLWKC
jgi:hypothetical protein